MYKLKAKILINYSAYKQSENGWKYQEDSNIIIFETFIKLVQLYTEIRDFTRDWNSNLKSDIFFTNNQNTMLIFSIFRIFFLNFSK